MKHQNIVIVMLLCIIGAFSSACTMCSGSGEFVIPDSLSVDKGALKVSSSVMEEMVGNISSPIEMASLMKSLNVPFTQKHLASTKQLSQYNTAPAKAFNLGVFGMDLGYLNMYGKASMVLDYITAMKNLADGINVGQFFDFSTLKRLATNSQDMDSLIFISQQSFNKMDKYLQRSNRGNLSTLMVSGVWVEGLYLSAKFWRERPNEQRLMECIGEQKVILDQLVILLKNYQSEPYIAAIVEDLATIKEIYDDIRITIEVGEPQAMEIDGMLTIVQTETSTVHITTEHLEKIDERITAIRNKMIMQEEK